MTSRPTVDRRSLLALVAELTFCGLVIALVLRWWTWPSAVLAGALIGSRQHALFILYHDAVHGLLARDRRLNDLLINLFAGVPMLLPVHVYRRFHVSHHATLGSEADTERLLLYRWQPWSYRPLALWPLLRQLLGDLLLLNQVRTGVALLVEQRQPDTRLRLPRARPFPETWALQLAFACSLAVVTWQAPTLFLRFCVLWFVPLLTWTQAIQKVRSFAEHAPLDAEELSYSWRPGLLGRWLLWPYNIHYHREHHERPGVPWHRLPVEFPDAVQRPGRELPRLLWNGRLWR